MALPPSPILNQDLIESTSDSELDTLIANALFARGLADSEQEHQMVHALSAGLRMFWGTDVMDGEVRNGGFLQFFWNSSAEYYEEAVAGFRLIGAEEHALLAEEATTVMEKDWPVIEPIWKKGGIKALFESYKFSTLRVLDDRWLKLPSFHERRTRYIRAHTSEFALT